MATADEDADVEVGAHVLVNNKHRAVVKYVGSTNFAEGVWYGLELERDIGKHTGTVLNVTYFVSPPKRGTFVKRENITPYDPANPPASAAPSKRAAGNNAGTSSTKRPSAREAMQRAFNALDADEEAQLFARRAALLQTALGQRLNRERPSGELLDRYEAEAAAMVVEPGYDGPHLSMPPTEGQVVAMMDAFRAGKRLHYKYAAGLVCWYKRYAGALPTLVQTSVPPGSRLTLCGDTHGQLEDLFSIFTINGRPGPGNRYLFNGDYVDRGERACEILLTLFGWCAVYPGEYGTGRRAGVLLNRGNHESGNQNMTGGFMMEVLDKYSHAAGGGGGDAGASGNSLGGKPGAGGRCVDPEMGLRMYDLFQAAFDCMPLAHLITTHSEEGAGEGREGAGAATTTTAGGAGCIPSAASAALPRRVFVTHGGLMQRPGIRMEHIASIKRKREIPYGLPGFEDKLFEDLMWSDPRAMEGHCPSDRGAGVFFGPDVTARFCATNGVSLVIRSHECVPEGFQFMHRDHLLTIFSASRYCGRGTNRGAFVVLEDDLSVTVQQYVAGCLGSTEPGGRAAVAGGGGTGAGAGRAGAAGTPRSAAAEAAALQREYGLSTAVEHGALRPPVEPEGPDAPGGGNTLSGGVVRNVGGEHASEEDEDAALLAAQEEAVRAMLVERICLHKSELYFFWSRATKAGAPGGGLGRGTITRKQWADGMRTVLNLDLPWADMAPVLALDEEPINYSTFLERFRIEMREEDGRWMEGILREVVAKMAQAFPTLESAFKSLDKDTSGELDYQELEEGLVSLQLGLSRSQLVELMNAIDANKDGRIQYAEFVQRFKESFEASATTALPPMTPAAAAAAARRPSFFLHLKPLSDAWAREVLTRVGNALVAAGSGSTTVALFTCLDADGDGVLSHAEFTRGVSARVPPPALGLTEPELMRLAGIIDANSSGSINYLEFAGAFTHVPAISTPTKWQPQITDAAAAQLFTAVATSSAAAGGSGRTPKAIGLAGSPKHGYHTHGAPDLASAAAWRRGVIEQIVSILYEFRVELAAAFRMFDTDGDGVISRDEFRQGLQALTGLKGSPITDWQADEMLRALDTDGDGSINYEEFVGGFKLVDARSGTVFKSSRESASPPVSSSRISR